MKTTPNTQSRPALGIDTSITSGIVASLFIGKEAEPLELIASIRQVQARAAAGDLNFTVDLLTSQVYALNAMFLRMGSKATSAKTLQAEQIYLQLALKAQAATRSTVEALAEMKNPRQVAFFKQTNVATTQQVNNAVTDAASTVAANTIDKEAQPARKKPSAKAPNKLKALEADDGSKTLDRGAAARAGRADPSHAPLDMLDRAPDA